MSNCSSQLCNKFLFGVKEVFQLEGHQHDLSLPKLKKLKLDRLEELEGLCKGPAHVLRLENLTTLTISGCGKLKHIFSFTLAQRLGQLESLSVRNCENLKQVFYLDHEREEYVGGGDHKNIVLPKLKMLELEGLAKVVSFFPEKYNLKSLEVFIIKDCCNLTTSFIVDEEKLRVLVVSNNNLILNRLRCGFYKNLEELQIMNCGVEVIFELGIHLLKLKTLYIKECGKLEKIIDVKDGEEVGANLLGTLSYLKVEKCHKLKNLFPISIARGFQQLVWLEVRDNSELEQIFGDNDVIDEKEIQLPQLGIMHLADLPRLTNLCHVDYDFIFPTLVLLQVDRCRKISIRFSWDEDNKCVHAEAKAPKIGSEDDTHEETSTDLLLYPADFQRKLPPYIKKEELYSNSH